MKNKRPIAAAAVVVAITVLLMTGCGTSESDAVEEAVSNYTVEFYADDGEWPGYTMDEINDGVLESKLVLNSCTDNPNIGDEREFIGIRENTGENKGKDNVWAQALAVENGKEYLVRLYITAEGEGTAKDVCVAYKCKDEASESNGVYRLLLTGLLQSSNTEASVYRSAAALFSSRPFHLEYVSGSALLENNGVGSSGGKSISDDIFGQYCYVNYSDKDGEVPVGDQYDSYVSIAVKVVYDE